MYNYFSVVQYFLCVCGFCNCLCKIFMANVTRIQTCYRGRTLLKSGQTMATKCGRQEY